MPGTNLTREEAAHRAALLTVDDYDVRLDLTTGPATFRTLTTVRFRCARPGEGTFLDLIADSVERIVVNGRDLDPATHFVDSRVSLPDLAADNEVTVDATGRYTTSGEGLTRFVDPIDGQVYHYTQFEVPDSRRMFAVFEQPDLKAAFRFTVTAPATWAVISNSPTPAPEPAQPEPRREYAGDVATWRFAPTPRISSYITALCAGPYAGVTDEVVCRAGTVPLGVYCRASLLPYLDADNIFDCTKRGFAFFEEEFDCAYPFAKYDQIFAPDYNQGAMENAGCVTIAETYVFRSKVSDAIVERRALTILHELAHMWFGDLVTMRWWDDLWLNESFAEWTSTTCQAEATQWTDAWTTFGIAEKTWAYSQDQLSSTHPVSADMRHLHDVEVNFDGITYAKGASVLKQLVAYVGRDAFREAVREYFRLHSWGNTEFADLVTLLQKHSGRDLSDWARRWLQTAGVNTLAAQVEVTDGRYRSVAIEQRTPAQHPQQRPHRLGIGRYDLRDGALTRTGYHEVDVDGDRTVLEELAGLPQPDLLLVNDDDLAYATLRWDERSLATILDNPRALTDPLPLSLTLASLWDMVRHGELDPRRYLEHALATLEMVEDSTTLTWLLGTLTSLTRRVSSSELGVLLYIGQADRPAHRARIAAALREAAQDAAAGSDRQFQIVVAAASLADDPDEAAWLAALLDGTAALPGLAMDADLRWTMLTALAACGRVDTADVDAELVRDPSARGKESAARTLAARPSAQAKEQAWAGAISVNELSNQMLAATGIGFVRGAPELLAPYVGRYHDALRSAWDERSVALGERVVLNFYPAVLAGPQLLAATQSWLDANLDAPPGLTRAVAEYRDMVARMVTAQERYDPA